MPDARSRDFLSLFSSKGGVICTLPICCLAKGEGRALDSFHWCDGDVWVSREVRLMDFQIFIREKGGEGK